MTENPKDYRHGHRERLREKFMAGKLADYELLELLLAYAIPRRDVKPMARELLRLFGNFNNVLCTPVEKLASVPGVGKSAAILIKVTREITLLDCKSVISNTPIFMEYAALEKYCLLTLGHKAQEEFRVLFLDTNRRLIADYLHSVGTINWAAIYPREIVGRALSANAMFAILMHNHPSGNHSFSKDDMKITHELRHLLKSVGVELDDHILVAGGIVYSAKNMLLMK